MNRAYYKINIRLSSGYYACWIFETALLSITFFTYMVLG